MKYLTYLFGRIKNFFCPDNIATTEDQKDELRRADNFPIASTPPLPPNETEEEKESKELWYPFRKIVNEHKDDRMRTRGYYQERFPKGAVIHFTAGRSRGIDGGLRNATTESGQGIRSLKSALKSPYTYFLIDREGNVYQNFPLNRWGYHAGKSSYPGLADDVSTDLVGIEVMNAGTLKKVYGLDKYVAWFTNVDKGDAYFEPHEMEHWQKTENIQAGYYHKFSNAQKKALVKLILWLNDQSSEFNLDYVVGHDEVAPERKCDPGGSLGMPMSHFREMLKDILEMEKSKV